jgi:phosphatidylglycerol lysyltransferase
LRFGLQSLLRGPMFVVALLAALLVPWTILLALSPAQHWFGSAYVKWGWVAFDLALLFGLWSWLQRPRLSLLTALSLAVSADACLTLAQALIWNVGRARGVLELTLVVIACVMPALAASVLWGAERRSRQTARAAPRL